MGRLRNGGALIFDRVLKRFAPIVVLANEVAEETWATISIFPDVYVVKGSMLEPSDLIRAGTRSVSVSRFLQTAGVRAATRVVIFDSGKVPAGPALSEDPHDDSIKMDAEPLFAYQVGCDAPKLR